MKFLRDVMDISLQPEEISEARRMGKYTVGKSNPLLISVTPDLKARIFNNTKGLKGKKNAQNAFYYVNQQLPDSLAEKRREKFEILKNENTKNSSLPKERKSKVEGKGNDVYINKDKKEKLIVPPKPAELFVDAAEQDKLYVSNPQTDKRSTFTAIAAKASSLTEIKRAYRKEYQLNPMTDHTQGGGSWLGLIEHKPWIG